MTQKWSEEEVHNTVSPLLKNQPTVSLTKTGALCIIFTSSAPGDRPLIGAYYDGETWYPSSWSKSGRYVDGETRALDLILHEHIENEVA
jgi:hypothetical protein